MSGLAALLNSDVVRKYFPFRNATPRSSVSLQLLYDLGVVGSSVVPGAGDVSALEARIAKLETELVTHETAIGNVQAELVTHETAINDVQTELNTFTSGTNYKCDQLAIKTIDQQKEIDQNKTDLALHVNNGEHWTGQQIDDRINAIVNP